MLLHTFLKDLIDTLFKFGAAYRINFTDFKAAGYDTLSNTYNIFVYYKYTYYIYATKTNNTTAMWHKSFSTTTKEVTKEQIWIILTDINKWKEWDKDLEWAALEGEAKLNSIFFLKPKGGPKIKLTISQFDKANIFEDISHLPFAKMQTTHTLIQTNEGLKIQVDIKIFGLLTFLWSKIIGQKQIEGGLNQTNQLIKKAKEL
ncbi:MAG: hypothetical protein ABI091_30665 [Ferruginibacter sp.]